MFCCAGSTCALLLTAILVSPPQVLAQEKPRRILPDDGDPTEGRHADAQDAFKDHAMCVNMLEKFETHLAENPSEVQEPDEAGFTLLHREALTGNLGLVQILVQHGADIAATTPFGRTAADLARGIGWREIADYLDEQAKA